MALEDSAKEWAPELHPSSANNTVRRCGAAVMDRRHQRADREALRWVTTLVMANQRRSQPLFVYVLVMWMWMLVDLCGAFVMCEGAV